METLAQRLKKYRTKKNLSLKAVAEKMGVPTSTYRDWEYGKAIQGEPYMKLARIFEIGLIELLTGKSPDHEELLRSIDDLENSVKKLKGIVLASE